MPVLRTGLRISRFIMISVLLAALISGVVASPATQSANYASDRVIVSFKAGARSSLSSMKGLRRIENLHSLLKTARVGTTPDSTFDISGESQVYQITDGSSVALKIKQLKAAPEVAFAEPDYQIKAFRMPSDPGYTYQWHLPKMGANAGWDTMTGSKKVKVCMLDSGIKEDHPDLKDNVEMGWNVVHNDDEPTPEPGDPKFYNYTDTLGHGTHVAGLVGAVGNNGEGVSGVVWRASLLVCRFIANSGTGYVSDAITCMRLCRDNGAHIYSNSWGGVDYQESLKTEIEAINAAGGLFIAAAGNDGIDLDAKPAYPASYDLPNLITVGASTQTDSIASFSNFGKKTVHMAAPGENMLSTSSDGDYGYNSGTSMAAPVTAGAAALVQSLAMNVYNTTLTPAQLRQLLIETTDPIINGADHFVSGGRINVARAMKALRIEQGGARVSPPAVATSPPSIAPPSIPPSTPPSGSVGVIYAPNCGTSKLLGAIATQSSVSGVRVATKAVDGNCKNDMTKKPNVCAATDPNRSNPWWTAPLANSSEIVAVSITTRADCCWSAIGGAIVLVGNTSWTGSGSRSDFEICGKVPASGIPRGQRMTIKCSTPLLGSHIAVFLPKTKTSLVLCEVDVTLKSLENQDILNEEEDGFGGKDVPSPPQKKSRKAWTVPLAG